MPISESLANGLKNRYFRQMEDEYVAFGKDLHRFNSKGMKMEAFVKRLWQASKSTGVMYFEGGTKRKPYFFISHLMPLEQRSFKEWNERCLFGNDFYFSLEPQEYSNKYACYGIGEHAIKRIFQRSISQSADEPYQVEAINYQLKYLPLWSSYLISLLAQISRPDEHLTVSFQIPSPGGILIAEACNKSFIAEVRTFVDELKLVESQAFARNSILKISDIIYRSPASFWAGSRIFPTRTLTYGIVLVSSFINQSSNKEEIINFLVQAGASSKEVSQRLLEIIDRFSSKDLPVIELIQSIGVRELLVEIEKRTLKRTKNN